MDRKTRGANPSAKCALPAGATIAVVGASARAAAMSVIRSGRRAVAADLFADADLQQVCPVTRISCYPTDLVGWLRDTPCDAWLYTGALENYPDLVDELAALRPLLGNPGSVLRQVRDPLVLQEVLLDHGFHFPETRTVDDGLPRDGSWLEKTYRGSSGVGVAELDFSTRDSAFFQRKITGDPCSALFAGRELVGVTRQLLGEAWTGARPFQYCGSLGPLRLPADAEGELRRLGEVLCKELGLEGLHGVDFMFDGKNLWTVELNPRYPASAEVVEQAKNSSMIDLHVASHRSNGLPKSPLRSRSTCYGKAILFGKLSTTASDEFTSWALAQPDLADIPVGGTAVEPGQPVLTVRAEAESLTLIMSALKSRMGLVESCLWGGVRACDWAS